MNGSATDWLPAATIAFWKRTTFFSPVVARPCPLVSATSTWCASRKRPTPCTTVTLRIRAIAARPVVSFFTTPSLKPRNLGRSICGSPNAMPCAAIPFTSSITPAVCSSAFDGMQPTLRHTPPRLW